MKPFTVILQTAPENPFYDMLAIRCFHVEAPNVDGAIVRARMAAIDDCAHLGPEDAEDCTPLAVIEGHHENLLPHWSEAR